MDIEFTLHAEHVLQERAISKELVFATLDQPARTELGEDGNRHYVRPFPEMEGRWLRVVVNDRVMPVRVVTAFFDRRLRRHA